MAAIAEEEGDADAAAHADAFKSTEEEEPRADLADLWQAWHALRFDRFYGAMGGSAPITFVAIDAYARRYGYEDESFDLLVRCIGAMDSVHLEIESDREKARQQK